MHIDVISIFPEYLAPARLSLVGKAIADGLVQFSVHDLRDATNDRHRTVDDSPYGGGPGMVMMAEPWGRALDPLVSGPAPATILVPTPSGTRFTQATAVDLAQLDHLVIACGRYEGIDARVWQHYRDTGVDVRELSIGDYVLAGGEAAAHLERAHLHPGRRRGLTLGVCLAVRPPGETVDEVRERVVR